MSKRHYFPPFNAKIQCKWRKKRLPQIACTFVLEISHCYAAVGYTLLQTATSPRLPAGRRPVISSAPLWLVGCQRSVSQPQSVLTLTPNSKAICFRVFRNFNRFCFIFWPRVRGASGDKKATNGVSLPLRLPSVGLVN